MERCPRCGAENSDHARFCQACGESLSIGSTRSGETRKTVTVLFMDVVGSTELGERLDPESARQVMGRLFDVVKPVLERHGGTVEKFIGDAVMAVFGIPAVHEDDALRACRAALEIQDEIVRLNKELERDWGVTISTRTGLNTGEVIAGDPSAGQTLVTGDPVNTAARLEHSAAPGTVLIGDATYRIVAHAVDVEPVEPVAAKGKAEAVPAFRLRSVVPGAPVRARRLDSPMVGRTRELGLLQEAFDRSVAEARCVLATVVGMAGVGKSRLVHEFLASIGDRATVLRGRCLPYGQGITFWPVVNVVHQAAGVSEGDSPEEARSKIEALLPSDEERIVILDRVAAAVSLGEATWSLQETFWAIRKLLEVVASDRPLIVVFDDIQWAEPTLLDLAEYLEGWSRTSAILLLCIARPELVETRAGWGSAANEPVTIELDPLTGEESSRLIRSLLEPSAVSDGFRRRIADTAEGNPLFVEEMLGMLIDEERLRREEGRWVASGDDSSVPTPPSIQSLLGARIEQLPEAERAILQRASVVGKVFWWGAVSDLSPEADRPRVGSHLQDLMRKGMVRPDRSDIAGHDAFRFRHILIRDAAYDSIPRTVRADLHERLATWIEGTVGERIDEYEEIVGYHIEQACQQRLAASRASDRELAARGARLLASAGRRSLDRDDINAALNLLARAWALNPADEREPLGARLTHAKALRLASDFGGADGVLGEVEERARVIGDPGLEWQAKVERLRIAGSTTNIAGDEVMVTAERAIEIFQKLGDDRGLASTWAEIGWMHYNAGRSAEGMEASAKAAHHWRACGDTVQAMWAAVSEAANAVDGPLPVGNALILCDELADWVKGQPGQEAAVSLPLALLEAMSGKIDDARAAIAHARSALRELGAAHQLAAMTSRAADVELYAGNPFGEERERRSGYEAFAASGADAYRATWAASLALSLTRLEGDDEEAFELTVESESLAAEDDITAQVPWREARAIIFARRGELDEAERLAREAVAIAERTDWLNLQGDAYMALAEVLRLAGRVGDAADAAQRAAERYGRKGNVVAAGWARDLVRELRPPGGRKKVE